MSQRTVTRKTMKTMKTVVLWALVGVAFLFSFAGMLSIGLFTMPLAVAGAILLLVHPGRMRGWAIMLCAVACAPLPVAWFNRNGPGRVCRTFPPDPEVFCSDQLDPWPWLAGAALSLAAGAVLFALAGRRDVAKSREAMRSGESPVR
jgi:hypothetical protein